MTISKLTISMVDFLKNLKDDEGATFKNGYIVDYKTGYQVATTGWVCVNAEKRANIIATTDGNFGVWYSGGLYYIDRSYRVKTKRKAIAIGKKYDQQSILKWADKSLLWL